MGSKQKLTVVALMAFLGTGWAESASAQVRVRAPFVGVDDDGGGVRVRAPFVNVDTDRGGSRVRAPFTNLQTDRYGSSHRVQLPPAGLPMVCIEFVDSPRASGAEAEEPGAVPSPQPLTQPPPAPAPRPMPESVRERESQRESRIPNQQLSREGENSAAQPKQPIDENRPTAYSSYLVIPVAAGQTRPNLRVYVDRAAATPKVRPRSGGAIDDDEASDPPREPSNVIRLQPAWHTQVTRYFQPTAGVHIFAFVHPYTQQTVPVSVDLPPGQPRVKVSADSVVFDYGRLEVKIRFRNDGRVTVRTDR